MTDKPTTPEMKSVNAVDNKPQTHHLEAGDNETVDAKKSRFETPGALENTTTLTLHTIDVLDDNYLCR